MKYCSPRAIEPRIPSYTHTNSTLRAIVRIAKPIFVLNSAAISNATLKEIIVTEILKATRVILTSTTTQTTDIQAFLQTPELKLCRNTRSALGELFEKRRL